MIVLCNVGVTLRIPSIVAFTFKESYNSASLILSGMQLIGILAGLTFSGLVHTFRISSLHLRVLLSAFH